MLRTTTGHFATQHNRQNIAWPSYDAVQQTQINYTKAGLSSEFDSVELLPDGYRWTPAVVETSNSGPLFDEMSLLDTVNPLTCCAFPAQLFLDHDRAHSGSLPSHSTLLPAPWEDVDLLNFFPFGVEVDLEDFPRNQMFRNLGDEVRTEQCLTIETVQSWTTDSQKYSHQQAELPTTIAMTSADAGLEPQPFSQATADDFPTARDATNLCKPLADDLFPTIISLERDPPEHHFNQTQVDGGSTPYQQKLRGPSDLYTPRWVRKLGRKRQGWCSYCSQGSWHALKDSGWWYHQHFAHGVAASGKILERPIDVKRAGDTTTCLGLCFTCMEWHAIGPGGKSWYRHVYDCQVSNRNPDSSPRKRGRSEGGTPKRRRRVPRSEN